MRYMCHRQHLTPDEYDPASTEIVSTHDRLTLKYRVSADTHGNLRTEVYQTHLRHKKFADLLNVVCVLKTNLTTKQQAHVLLFSSDLSLDAEKMIDYYSLRFQIEFNFRDAKQYWGLQSFMNVNKIPVNNAANLSMFMVNVSAKLIDTLCCKNTAFSVLDLRAHYRGLKYLHETLKILPQNLNLLLFNKSHNISEQSVLFITRNLN